MDMNEIVPNRIRPSEVAVMTRQLSTLVGAGFPLVTALQTPFFLKPVPRD